MLWFIICIVLMVFLGPESGLFAPYYLFGIRLFALQILL